MTLILAFKHQNKTILAGDKLGSNDFDKALNKQPKVFCISNTENTFNIGYTSSFRFGQILEKVFQPPRDIDGLPLYDYMVKLFVPSMREVLEEGKYSAKDEKGTSGNCLVVVGGRIFEIQTDFSVLEHVNEYNAVGSGSYHANAVLESFKHFGTPTCPKEICTGIFKTVSSLVMSVSEEFDMLEDL